MNHDFLMAHPDGVRLQVRVQPRASRTQAVGLLGNALKIRLAAPPVDGAANAALLLFLAETLDCPRSALELLTGHSSKQKTVLIRGIPPEQVRRKLLPA